MHYLGLGIEHRRFTVGVSPRCGSERSKHTEARSLKGNVLDWSLKASNDIRSLLYHTQRSPSRADLQLDGVEFSSLPSGLHPVEQDIMYVSVLHLAVHPSYLSGPGTSRRTACAGCASLAAARLPSTVSAASTSPPSASSSSVPCARALGATSRSNPSCASSTPLAVLLPRTIPAQTSGRPHGSSSNCARHILHIWMALVRGISGMRNSI